MKIKLINRICTVAIAILMCFFLVFCPFVFTSFCAYASSVLGNDFFWDILQSTYDFQQTANYMNDFITVPSDEFNNALKNLVDKNYPFGGTPHLQNSYGSIPITLTSTPVAYLPFFYESTQSSNNISLANLAICVTSDKCAKLNLTSNGFSSSGITGTLPSYPAYAIYGSSSNVSLATFNTSNDALSDLNHWVRFEIEFHDKNAAAVLSKFLDCKTDSDFSKYISRVSYNLIRFVDKDHTRLYNCTVCDWWMKFLGSLEDKGMYINKLSTNSYLAYKKYSKRCLAACLAALVSCEPDQLNVLLEEGKANPTKSSLRIEADYKAYQGLSPGDKKAALEEAYRTLSGEDYWRMFADQTEGDFDERMRNIFEEVAY